MQPAVPKNDLSSRFDSSPRRDCESQVAGFATGIRTSSNHDDVVLVKVTVTVVLALCHNIAGKNSLPHLPQIVLDGVPVLLRAWRPTDTDDDGVEREREQRECGAEPHSAAEARVSTRVLDDPRGERSHGFRPGGDDGRCHEMLVTLSLLRGLNDWFIRGFSPPPLLAKRTIKESRTPFLIFPCHVQSNR